MKDYIIKMPGEVHIGKNKSEKLADIIKDNNMNEVLLVIDKSLVRLGLTKHIFESLDSLDIDYEVFSKINGEPTVAEVDQAITELDVEQKFDGVIGIGGGSTLDVAKLLAVSEAIEGTVKNYFTEEINQPGLPTIMIPTTAGTGSEATPNSIIKDEVESNKKGIVSPYLIPDIIILDPELTKTLPPRVTAETGIDAFTHAIECYICNKENEVSNLFARESMKLIYNNIREAVNNGDNLQARYNMLLGSFYGGIAITNSGTGGVHALAYPLGGEYNVSHGLSNSILLSEVMKFNSKAVPDKFINIAELMEINRGPLSEEQLIDEVIKEIEQMVNDVGIDSEDLDISEGDIEFLSKAAMDIQRLLKNNPRPINIDDARNIYINSLLKEEI